MGAILTRYHVVIRNVRFISRDSHENRKHERSIMVGIHNI